MKKFKHNQKEQQTQVVDNQANETTNATEAAPQNTANEQPKTDAQLQEFTTKITELEEKCADLADQKLRMMAEFDNYRRRVSKEKLDLEKTAGERIFKDMLPLLDDFERAINAMQADTEEQKALKTGIDLIYNKFLSFLEKNGVQPISTTNADFDTEFHEAIALIPAPTEEQKGKVIDCVQKGYTLGEKVIRYAKVVVGE